jgi:hypothetical protein
MKKQVRIVALTASLLAGTAVNAQTPVGTLVNDFTLTDIDGNTHQLYDYLDAGKMVVIDVSATWCGPCWAYHNTGALNDFYLAHGPSGADDAMVLFVEGDPSTNNADLNGTGTNTQGDWVTGEDMPIIDLATSSSFENSGMDIAYFPVMYVICPNRTILQSGVAGAIGTLSNLNSYVGDCAVATAGTNAAINQYSGTIEAPCGDPATAKIMLQNMGTNPITALTITGTVGSQTLGPINWVGNLTSYEFEEVNLGAFTLTGPETMNIAITTADALLTDNGVSVNVSNNAIPVQNITVQINTDAYGSETTWTIKNSGGTTVSSGGPYSDQGSAGSFPQTPVNVNLPAGCYTFLIEDSYGDGMDAGYGAGFYAIKYGSTTVLTGGVFTNDEERKFTTTLNVGVDEVTAINSVSIYPNPVSEMATLNIELTEASDVVVNVMNSLGQIVASANMYNAVAGLNKLDINFAEFESGIYYVNVVAGDHTTLLKVVK